MPRRLLEREIESRKERCIVGLADVVCLQNHIAGAFDFAEVHARAFQQRGPLHALQPVERFPARLGLLV